MLRNFTTGGKRCGKQWWKSTLFSFPSRSFLFFHFSPAAQTKQQRDDVHNVRVAMAGSRATKGSSMQRSDTSPYDTSRHSSNAAVYTSCANFQTPLASWLCCVYTSAESTLFVVWAPVLSQTELSYAVMWVGILWVQPSEDKINIPLKLLYLPATMQMVHIWKGLLSWNKVFYRLRD